ncbi:hypothetical protein [Anaerostipes sp.]|uniref:hypothetical protein n=1 Tax=Anaerostipes sp. TaxID=1872530 RepID=UPI0025C4E703|nr:hypothetical protein [Anaerostipes sp.]
MAETLVLNMKGNFTDKISPGAGKAYRSLEKLDKKMEKIIRQCNRLNGLKINMQISAVDTATKKIQNIISLGKQLERRSFNVRVNVDTNVQKAISAVGSVSGNSPQSAVSSAGAAIQYGIGQAVGRSSTSSDSTKPKGGSKQKPFIEKVWDKGKSLAKEYKDTVVSDAKKKLLEKTIKEYKNLSEEAGLPEEIKTGVNKIKGGASKAASKVKSWPISKTVGKGVEKVTQVAPKIKELPITKTIGKGVKKVAQVVPKVKGLPVTKTLGKGLNFLKKGAPGILDYAVSGYNIATAKPKDRARTAVKEGGGLLGGAVATAALSAKLATLGTAFGPVGTIAGAGVGLLAGAAGTLGGEKIAGALYDGVQNVKKNIKNIKVPKPIASAGKFLKKGLTGVKNLFTPKTPKIPTKPSDKIDPYGVGNDTYSDYMYNPGFKYGYDTIVKGQKKGAKKQKKATRPNGKAAGKKNGKDVGKVIDSTVNKTKKSLKSMDKGTKNAKKGMSGVGKSSNKAKGDIKNLGSTSNGSQKQVQGLGDGSQNAAGMIEGMGGSAIGVVDALSMLSGAAQVAAASLASISLFNVVGGAGVAKNANGSFVGGKMLSWVGEDGPEVIIPLGGKRRKRGLDLWQQAGAMLGVSQHADGGFVGGGSVAGSGRSGKKKAPVSVSVGNITIQLKGGQDGNGTNIDLLKVLKEQKNQVSDEICRILADALESAYQNIPAVQ